MPRGGSKPGERRGGRQKGTPNKMTAGVKAALTAAFEQMGGVPFLVRWGTANPTEFFALWGKMLPTEVANADGEAFRVQQVTEVIVTSRAQADSVLALNGPS